MRLLRRLHTALTLACVLLLAGVVALWRRSSTGPDALVLRTAPSYAAGPALKYLVVRTDDGLEFFAYVKIKPSVEAGDPPWRDDVPFGYVPAPGPGHKAPPIKQVVAPTFAGGRPMNDADHRGYEAAVAPAFAATPSVRRQPPAPVKPAPAPRPALPGGAPAPPPGQLGPEWLGVQWVPQVSYRVGDETFPGAYRNARLRVPFDLAAAVFAAPLLTWVPLWMKRRAERRRVRRGLCRRCGYDLRESPRQCPECGRVVPLDEAGRAPRSVVRDVIAHARSLRPRTVLVGAAAVVVLAVLAGALSSADLPPVAFPSPPERPFPATAGVPPGPLAPDAFRTLRFNAMWPEYAAPPNRTLGVVKSFGGFDVTGPVQPTLRKLPLIAGHATTDHEGRTWCAGGAFRLMHFRREFELPEEIGFDPSLPKPALCGGLAFDPRRGQLMLIGHSGTTASTYTYSPSSGRWTYATTFGRLNQYASLTYSEADECFYALSSSLTGNGFVQAVTCIAPDGKPRWQIPLPARVFDAPVPVPGRWNPQVVAAGSLLAILTPPLPDPLGSDGLLRPRCVLIDPRTITVQYSGALTPHESPGGPTTASSP